MDDERMEEGLEAQLKKALEDASRVNPDQNTDDVQQPENSNSEQKEVAEQEEAPEQKEVAKQEEAPEQKEVAEQEEAPEQKEVAGQEEAPEQKEVAEQKDALEQEQTVQYRMPETLRSNSGTAEAREHSQNSNKKKRKKKKGKIIALTIVALVVAAAAVYAGFSWQYKDKFFNGTVINGIDCSGMTVAQVEEQLKKSTEDYEITLVFRDGKTETIAGEEFGYTYVSDGSVQALKNSQIPLMWITSLFETSTQKATVDTEFDSDALEAALCALPEMQEDQMAAPTNAYVTWQETGFVIVPETEGTQIDTQKVVQAVSEAVGAGETELDLTSLDVYAKPTVLQDDEGLKEQQAQLSSLVGSSITYTLPSGNTQVLDGNTLKDWLVQGEDGSYTKDENIWNQHIQQYVEGLANAVDTWGKDREFVTTNRGTITRNSNLYGWRVDQEEEIAQLTQELASQTVITREPVYASREVSSENNGIGYTYIEMDLSQQHLWVYENGQLWGETDLVSGTMTQARHTPECISTIYYKEQDRQLRGPQNEDGSYRWDTHVDYWMPFQDSGMIGMHDAWWQASFGGTNYIYGGSQGCINLPPEFAARLYEWITEDVPIICYYSEPYTLHE